MTAVTRTGRATPLPPEARRAAIIDATIPLLRSHGLAITTRQIAAAAGVAEGTVFSVFADKETLIAAAVEAALDPEPVAARLAAIDPDLVLDARLAEAVQVLQGHITEIWQLLVAVGPDGQPRRHPRDGNAAPARHVASLTQLLAPDAARLRRSPADAAQALFALTLGCSHPGAVDEPMPPDQIVDLWLDGVRTPDR